MTQKILIIEDEIAIRNVLKRILLDENKRFQIDEAMNGEEGLKKNWKQIIILSFVILKCQNSMD